MIAGIIISIIMTQYLNPSTMPQIEEIPEEITKEETSSLLLLAGMSLLIVAMILLHVNITEEPTH